MQKNSAERDDSGKPVRRDRHANDTYDELEKKLNEKPIVRIREIERGRE
jgi:hypothetical protein